MPHKPELCENCGGKLAVAYNWRKLVVCGPCYRELSAPPPAAALPTKRANLWPMVAAAVVILASVAGGIVLTHGRRPPNVALARPPLAASRSSDSGPAPAGLSPEEQAQFALLMAHHRAVQPTSLPASLPSTGTLAGVIRFARPGRRDPELQPGLRVQLLRTTVRRRALQSSLAAEGQGWRELADAYAGNNTDTGSAQSDQNSAAAGGAGARTDAAQTPGGGQSDSTQTDEDQQFAQQTSTGITRIQSATERVPPESDTAAALTTLADLAVFNVPNFDDCVADATMMETRTDDEGKYEFKEVPPGDYYLHAVRIGERAFTEWCLPVHLEGDGQPIHLDLTNANAAVSQTNR